MKTIIVLATLVAAALGIPSDTYSQFDSVNVKELTENPRVLKNYGKCFLEKGPCTSEGTEIKNVIGEALQTKCGKCTPKQRESVRIMMRAFQRDLPDMWLDLLKKYDPNDQYKESIDKFLNADD